MLQCFYAVARDGAFDCWTAIASMFRITGIAILAAVVTVPCATVLLCTPALCAAKPAKGAEKTAEKAADKGADKSPDKSKPDDKAKLEDKAKSDDKAKSEDKASADDKTKGDSKKPTSKEDAKKGEPTPKVAVKEIKPEDTATPVGEDASKLGPFAPPVRPFPFPLLGDDKAREVFVDRAGSLYKERPYSGNVPDWNTAAPVGGGGRCKVEAQGLVWIGFQNNADGSRVYVQLENAACGYVYRPDDLHIVIDLPQVTIAGTNLRREILTGAFPTAIEMIKAEDVPGKGARVVIVLRERRPYLSAHLGKYLFVDVTR